MCVCLCVAEMGGGITWRKYVSFCRFHGVGQQSCCIKLSQGRCWRTEQHVSAGKNSLTLSMGEQREESLRKKKKYIASKDFLTVIQIFTNKFWDNQSLSVKLRL